MLVVTSGCGWVQREGGEIEEIRPGYVVRFEPGEKHWHGAAATTGMAHIAIQESLDGKAVEWMEHVTDEEYGGTKWFVRNCMEVLRMESAQEGTNIRTATVYPAAINTELLDTITHEGMADGMTELYQQYGISADRIANIVAFAIGQPEDTNVNEFTVGPTAQPW